MISWKRKNIDLEGVFLKDEKVDLMKDFWRMKKWI
jgi:hypothetical protein